jgi:hypothetical protein
MALDLTELPASVRKMWDAVVPPATELIVTAIAVTYLLDLLNLQRLERLVSLTATLLPQPHVQEVLRFYGLSSLIPIVVIVGIIVLSQATGRFLRWLGRYTPGKLVQNTTAMMCSTTSPHEFGSLWLYHPSLRSANGINTLNSIINEEVERSLRDPASHHRWRGAGWFRRQAERYSDRVLFLKGLIGVLVVLYAGWPFLASVGRRPTTRLLFVVLILACALLFYARLYVRAEYQYARQKIRAYLDWKDATTGSIPAMADDDWVRTSEAYEELSSKPWSKEVWDFRLWMPRDGAEPTLSILAAFKRFIVRNSRLLVDVVRKPFLQRKLG